MLNKTGTKIDFFLHTGQKSAVKFFKSEVLTLWHDIIFKQVLLHNLNDHIRT